MIRPCLGSAADQSGKLILLLRISELVQFEQQVSHYFSRLLHYQPSFISDLPDVNTHGADLKVMIL